MKNRLFRVFIFHSLPLLFVTILLGGGAMVISYVFAVRANEQQAHNQLEQIQAYYEVILAEMDSLNLMFSTNSEIITRLRYILEADRWEWMDSNYAKLIRSYISAPANARPYIDSIYVYLHNDRGRFLSSHDGILVLSAVTGSAWFDSFVRDGGVTEFRAEEVILNLPEAPGISRRILRIFRTIYDTKPQPIGVIVLDLLPDRLVNDYPSHFAAEGSSLTIRDNSGVPLILIPPNAAGVPEEESARFAGFSLISPRFGWNFELRVPRSYLYRIPRTIGIMTIALSVLACVLGLLLTYKTNQKENLFLRNVLDQFEAAGVYRFGETTSREKRGNIFDYLNTQILRTFLMQDYLRIQKEVMEYRALQMQINPHFLFNALETINWSAVALLKGPNDVSRMIQLLSGILKYSMQISEISGVPLEEEIKHTRSYLELQNFRFAGKFSVEWNIALGLESFPVPRLFFQPILENSFTHGFRDDNRPLRITIDIHREGDRLLMLIEDNGEGIDPETLKQLNSDEPAVPAGKSFIGLANIRKRTILFYKGNTEITITSKEKTGTKIRFSIPV
ncbi:MAG: histidine kinase [Spirochaetaceae bacterium]|jgi:two-component system sensor histidine kinase YesM|nr:histidine kinase [Spirochaetaceae bacterium]